MVPWCPVQPCTTSLGPVGPSRAVRSRRTDPTTVLLRFCCRKGTRVTLLAVTGGGQIGDAGFPLANPVGWECKWNATQDDRFFLMFMPRCPAGYVALGGCFQSQRCVRDVRGIALLLTSTVRMRVGCGIQYASLAVAHMRHQLPWRIHSQRRRRSGPDTYVLNLKLMAR